MDLSGVKKKSLLGVKENNKKSSTRAPSPTKRKDRSDEKSKDRSKDKGGTKESSEKDRGRDKIRKRRSASSGSSSTRWASSLASQQHEGGRRLSTPAESFVLGVHVSSFMGREEAGDSERTGVPLSGGSSGSPSPSRRRHDNRRRSRSKSKPPKRDEKERKRRSPSPKPTKVHIGRLTRNVTKDHIMEIFSTYGKIKMIDMPVERMHPHLSKGYAYVEFENPDEAEKALKHMDGGQIDGQEITATAVLAPWPRPPPRRFSPPRRMLPPPPMWRRSPPRMRRRSRSPRRRSPVRRRSRSPGRRRHRSRSSSNSSR
uniref:RNA-binding protein with serine-rich domain 1 n=1 Tax=Loxodonta africana TaxID=9785 RepID=G3SM97_LOXAF